MQGFGLVCLFFRQRLRRPLIRLLSPFLFLLTALYRYTFRVRMRLCFIDITFNKDEIPEERRFSVKASSVSGAAKVVVVRTAQVAPLAAVAPAAMGDMESGAAVAPIDGGGGKDHDKDSPAAGVAVAAAEEQRPKDSDVGAE